VDVTTHFHLLPRLKITAAIPPVPPYAFMVYIRTLLPFSRIMNNIKNNTTRGKCDAAILYDESGRKDCLYMTVKKMNNSKNYIK
jgi:hypothetical protein